MKNNKNSGLKENDMAMAGPQLHGKVQ